MMNAANERAFMFLLGRLHVDEVPDPLCITGGDLRVGDIMAWHGEVLAVYPHWEYEDYVAVHVVRRGIETWIDYPVRKQCPIAENDHDDPRHRGGPRKRFT